MKPSCILSQAVIIFTVLTTIGVAQNPSDAPSHYAINPEAIARVEVLYFPEQFETRAALTPGMLEKIYLYKVEMRDFESLKEHQELTAALKKTVFSPSRGSYDLRTAVLIYDRDGKRLLSLYFGRGGRNGVVNNQPVSRSDYLSSNFAIYQWTKSILAGLDH